jgi:hypothetical protein
MLCFFGGNHRQLKVKTLDEKLLMLPQVLDEEKKLPIQQFCCQTNKIITYRVDE